jgi:hypothetical protein
LKFNFDQSFKLSIEMEADEKLRLLSEFSKANNTTEPMIQWFDDPNVPQQEKDNFIDALTNAMAEMNFLYQLLKKCGLSDQEIYECANIPF